MHLSVFQRFVLLISIFASLGFASLGFAQTDQQDQIQTRLDEVRKMIDEERSTVNVLEGQLKSALDDRDKDRIEQLRKDIETAYDSLESLEDLKSQLRGLQESAAKDNRGGLRQGAPRGRRKIPTPSIGGLEGPIDWDSERKRREDKRDRDAARDRAERGNSGPAIGGNRPSRTESAKLRQLRDALDALVDAGLDDLADEVRTQIKAEEDKLKRRNRPRRGDRDRDDRGNRGDDRGGNVEGSFIVGDEPTSADGRDRRPSSRRKPGNARGKSGNRSNERSRDRRDTSDFDDEIQDLEDKIDRLREKLRDMKDDNGG